jgi:ABC-2 type transport system ATP-binding protein/lipopolysaccharide transport system ATP-binding protein
LRALAGIYQITEGEIRIRGRVSCLLAIGVGMDPDATGRENIRLAGIVGGVPWSELDALIKDVSEFADLGEFLDFPMRTYSSGMSMRLSFGIATWIKPDILFVDELIGVGDVLFYKKAEERLSNLLHAARILFLASHNFDVIRQFCNKALLLENGEMVSFGDVEDTFDRYLAAAETKTE